MPWTRLERRWRDALLASILPSPGDGRPGLGDVSLDDFWPRFHAVAPWHLRVGLRLAVFAVAGVLPWLLLHFRTLPRLNDDQRDAVVVRADRLPLFRDLLEVAKLVACLAYFADPDVQAAARAAPPEAP